MPQRSMTLLSASVEKNENEKETRDIVEQDLVEQVCRWSRRVLVSGCAAGAVFGYIGGEDPSQLVNPTFVSLFGVFSGFLFENVLHQMAALMCVLTLLILRHSLNQGCSACLVPAIYGFLPCASGFLFRSTHAVAISTVGVLAATSYLYAVDLSGNCTSDPLDPSDKGTIIADRLVPLLVLIIGNSSVLTIIVRQSQDSLLLHAKAAKSASNLADMRRDVLHRVTHELRTPLNAMVGSVELLTSSDTMPDIDMENALTIKRCLSTILSICDDVLLAAKSDRVKVERPFLLASCIDNVAEFFAASVEAKGMKLKVEYDGDTTAVVRGMEVKLRQVMLNLVGNALKFTDSGSITIRVHTQDDPSSPDKLQCQFEVQDTGIGVDTESSEMLFEAFHQGEQGAVSRRHMGTGLGLTICRDLVSLMGGSIGVNGVKGRGSRFFFTLVLKKEEGKVPDIPLPEKACRIVIADSEHESLVSCQSLVKSIAPVSACVSTVDSPQALLELVASEDTVDLSETRCVAFLACDSTDPDLSCTLSKMKQTGWLVIPYCNHGDFPKLVEKSSDAYAVFRRPLQLARMADSLCDALTGKAPHAQSIPESIYKDAASARDVKPENTTMMDEPVVTKELPAESARTTQNVVEDSITGHKKIPVKSGISKKTPISLERGAKVVVVDDTPLNVKVMVKMLSRSTSVPIVSLFDGQSAIDLVKAANHDDVLLFLMDWHMPGTCGISATESIRRFAKEHGGPRAFICMITADLEGLRNEMKRRNIHHDGTVGTKGRVVNRTNGDTVPAETTQGDTSDEEIETGAEESPDEFTVLDLIAGKPVTFQSIQAILTWFQEQVNEAKG